MKIFVIKNNKIIKQENEGYQPKEGEMILIAKESEWPILKRTGGKFFEINVNDKKEGDILQGAVTKFKVLRDGKETVIDRDKKIETDKLLDFVQPPDMIRVYRGGTSILTTVDKFNHKTEAIEYSYTKHDYKIENDKLVLLTDQERIEKAKEKKKKEIANQLNSLYPERLIDGTMQELYNEKVIEIDALGLNENLTINEKLAEIKLYSL